MPINLSAANKNAVYAMSLLDSQSLTTQQRLATGNAVNSASDDPIKYFRSVDLSTRAKYIKSVAENTDLTLANITAADKAMSQIKEQMTKLQEVINGARSTSTAGAAAGVTTNSTKQFQPAVTTANRMGAQLTNPAEANVTGYSMATTVRNKLLFDDNGGRGDGATEAYSGNVGLNALNAVNFNASSRLTMQIQIGTDTVSVTLANTASKQNSIGDLVDQMNARIQSLATPGALAGTRLAIDGEGRFRIYTGATTNTVKIGFGMDNGTGATVPAVNNADTETVMNQLGFGRTFQRPEGPTVSYLNDGFGIDARQSNAYDASMIGTTTDTFQDGDVFSISLVDRLGNTTQAFFRATTREKMALPEAQNGSQNSPIKFSSLGELVDAINGRFAANGSTARLNAFFDVASGPSLVDALNPVTNVRTPTALAPAYRLRLAVADPNTQMRIQQTQNNDTNYVDVARTQLGAGFATTRKIAANNLVSIFGQPAPDPTTGLAGVSTRLSGFNETSDPNDPTNTFRTQEEYMNLVWAAQPSNVADPKRAAARLQWQNTVRVIDEILRQGRLDMGGQPNILNGEQVRIQLAQDNSRAYTFNLPGRFDRAFLQIGANDFDFGVDGAIDQASNQITTGLTNLTNAQSNLATHSVALTGFSSFYKDMATFYQSNADTIIKADMNQESNNLKALQTMQQITQAVMGINNQNEQGVTRLLY